MAVVKVAKRDVTAVRSLQAGVHSQQGYLNYQIDITLGYYNHALRQVANLLNKANLCVKKHATMFVQVYANPFIGERIMNI